MKCQPFRKPLRVTCRLESKFLDFDGDFVASISISSLELLVGRLPRRVLALVLEWAMIHRPELRHDWKRCERREPLLPIAGLDQEA